MVSKVIQRLQRLQPHIKVMSEIQIFQLKFNEISFNFAKILTNHPSQKNQECQNLKTQHLLKVFAIFRLLYPIKIVISIEKLG